MSNTQGVLEYKCPCCGAGLTFSETAQKLSCAYCDNTFELEAVKEYNEAIGNQAADSFEWEQSQQSEWSESDQRAVASFICPSCGGEIMTDATTAATFCPYCENPTIIPGRVQGGIKPDAVIPFQNTKEDAQRAFQALCKGKPLLPKNFASQQRIEKITGMYVPFWLYECDGELSGQYRATRVHSWSDSRYHYTKTDHYMLDRQAEAVFKGIPMDGSTKMDNGIMESIEPYDQSKLVDFDTAYLSGFLADKYDVEAKVGEARIRQRVRETMDDMLRSSIVGYTTVTPTQQNLQVQHGKAKYVLMPVWMLHSKYQDKTYVFAMNGQTGKMTGTFPICPKRRAAWFGGIFAAVSLLAALVQWIAL